MANFNQGGGTIWNMDAQRMYELNAYLISFMRNLNANELDYAYEDLESIDLILSGSIHTNVSKGIKEGWEKAEKTRRLLNREEDDDKSMKLFIEFRELLKTLFRLYNQSNIQNKMYFRKGDDPQFAALKR